MATTLFNSVEEIVSNLSKGTFGVTMVSITIPKMSIKKRGTSKVNEYYGRVHKCTMTTNVALGYDYESNVNIRLERGGKNADFKAEKPNGKHWVNYPFILASDKNPDQHYLRTTARKSSKQVVVWLVDGKPCKDESVLNEIHNWTSSSSSSKKQKEHGLSDEDQVRVYDYKVEGIMCIAQGGKTYNKLDKVFTIDVIKNFFK